MAQSVSTQQPGSAKYPARVAIIDDDEQLLLSMSSLLRSFEITALPFQSAEDFFDAGPAAVDCVIADIHMPGMNGLAMIDRLREAGSKVPVIVISALDPESTRPEAMARGADAYFSKPVDSEDLLDCLVRVMSERDGMDGN
jgi:FixJ family two-component response regulator